MKPTESEIAWCLANREVVTRWLERRGGWQQGDWAYLSGEAKLVRQVGQTTKRLLVGSAWYAMNLLWLPTSDDALEMLGQAGILPILDSAIAEGEGKTWVCWSAYDGDRDEFDVRFYDTPTIALMELLKSLEGKND